MTKELQDHAWSILPKEFKEEVKEEYFACKHCSAEASAMELEIIFGEHNLTSDTEGEEMLICEKSKVQRAYNTSREIVKAENPDSLMYSMHTQIMCVLENIFGSKCLPDANEDNFVSIEPKPSEPKEEADEHFDTIVKGGFREHNRLHIAAMAMQGILSNADRMKKYEYVATEPPYAELEVVVARKALRYAGTLIAECKKGGEEE